MLLKARPQVQMEKREPSGPARPWPGPGPHLAATDIQEGAGDCKPHDSRCKAGGRLAKRSRARAARWPSLRLIRDTGVHNRFEPALRGSSS